MSRRRSRRRTGRGRGDHARHVGDRTGPRRRALSRGVGFDRGRDVERDQRAAPARPLADRGRHLGRTDASRRVSRSSCAPKPGPPPRRNTRCWYICPCPRATRRGPGGDRAPRDASPSTTECNHTGYISYAIADLWVNRDPADVNAKLASLQFSHYGGDPSACSAHSNQARNNLMLGYLVRPYFLYNATAAGSRAA